MNHYKWKDGARCAKLDAARVGARLDALRKRLRRAVQACDVVAEARDSKHPAHGWFEWDDTRAGAAYREEQARDLIRSLIIIRRIKPGDTSGPREIEVRAYEHSKSLDGYDRTEVLLKKRDSREELLQKAWVELRAWRGRYESLREFAEVIEVIDRAIDKAG